MGYSIDGAYDLESPTSPLSRVDPYTTHMAVRWPPGSDGSVITYDGVDSAFGPRSGHLDAVLIFVSVWGNWDEPPTISARLYTPDESASASGSAVAKWSYNPSWGAVMIVPLVLPTQVEADALYDAAFQEWDNGGSDHLRLDVSLSNIQVALGSYPDPTGGFITDEVAVAMRTRPGTPAESAPNGALFK